jgi:hypothetical protein
MYNRAFLLCHPEVATHRTTANNRCNELLARTAAGELMTWLTAPERAGAERHKVD